MIPARARDHAVLSAAYLLTRVLLHAAGIAFELGLDWMWLADPEALRSRLWETLYYFHAFPPGMNLLAGVLLKVGGASAAALALAVFWAFGLAIVNALYALCRAAGTSGATACLVAFAFSMLPQSIYFEHLFLYEYPVTALLATSAVLFHAAVTRQAAWAWFGFFLACALIGLTRSTFHLAWFMTCLALALWSSPRPARRRVLVAASLPAVLLLSLYVKNLVVFGRFDAFTFGPVSQSLVTTWRLPPEVRDAWIADGRLSPLAAVSVYAGPRAYLPFVDLSEHESWPSQLTDLERRSIGAPNYNHWLFVDVNRIRRDDAMRYVAARPLEYAGTVMEGLRDFFTASTRWHPLDASGGSPHARHRQLLGTYEALVNRAVHGFPVAPVGLYVFLPAVLGWAAVRTRALLRAPDQASRARGTLLVFCLFQVGFVVAASALFTFRESARYRFQIEPMIWMLTAMAIGGLTLPSSAPTIPSHPGHGNGGFHDLHSPQAGGNLPQQHPSQAAGPPRGAGTAPDRVR